MANEAEIAGRTRLIADAMFQANRTLRDVLQGLETADRTIGTHLTELQKLSGSAQNVLAAERQSEWYGQMARTTRDHDHMEKWNDADTLVRAEFGRSQVVAGELSSQIGGGQRALTELGDDLDLSQGRLKGAMAHLEALDRLPEFAGSDQASGLRAAIEHLQQATAQADAGIDSTIGSLDLARRAANRFERGNVQIGEFRHSQAINSAGESVAADVMKARSTLQSTGTAIYEGRQNAGQAAQFGIDAFNVNQAAQQQAERAALEQAAGEGGQVAAGAQSGAASDPELAHSMHAGTAPGPAAGTGEAPKPVDPRIDYMMPAKAQEKAGQRNERGSER
ncbi:hypothetical protein [Kribbella sp. NPDC004536]|uniref:hypothetical protein n=1 Tax=Kribbella sp. NPDC004536 TaxID=3364106 RepID=UPI00368C0C5A